MPNDLHMLSRHAPWLHTTQPAHASHSVLPARPAGITCHFCRQKKLCGERDCPRCNDRDYEAECIGELTVHCFCCSDVLLTLGLRAAAMYCASLTASRAQLLCVYHANSVTVTSLS